MTHSCVIFFCFRGDVFLLDVVRTHQLIAKKVEYSPLGALTDKPSNPKGE